jgi:hypothetical protein
MSWLSRHPLQAASALVLALTIFLTWPQAVHLGDEVASHNDPYLSMWRLGWFGHAARVAPTTLYDANIFYPDRLTLAYTDATLLEGALAAPLLWAGLSPVLVYNILLLGGIALSGLGMFILARHLTGSTGSALFAAAFFTLLPYRVEHFMHLELQWMVWIPLALWAAHRAVDEGSWRYGGLCGLFVGLQTLSCVYYGAFLAMIAVLLGTLLIMTRGGTGETSGTRRAPPWRALTALGIGSVVAASLAVVYAHPYLENARTLGPREISEVKRYSAEFLSYLTAPRQNWAWGWTADRFDGDELHITPGVVTLVLALVGVAGKRSRDTWIYLGLCGAAVELSLGMNGRVYPWLWSHVTAFQSLRAIARFSVLAFCPLAVLAGFGVAHLQRQFTSPRTREWVAATAIMFLTLECGSLPMSLEKVPSSVPPVYRVLSRLPPGAVAEFPMAEPGWMPGFDPRYQYWSMAHWHPLINGYSGYVSNRYVDMLRTMGQFPDRRAMAKLRELNVRYVLVHQALYDDASQWSDVEFGLLEQPDVTALGRYNDWTGDTALFELR